MSVVRIGVALALTLLAWVGVLVTVPSMWLSRNVVDESGYVSLARSAGADDDVRAAMTGDLTGITLGLAARQNVSVPAPLVRQAVAVYTRSDRFPDDFAAANRAGHRWLFTDKVSGREVDGEWVMDVAPMLRSLDLRLIPIAVPDTVQIRIGDEYRAVSPGYLHERGQWVTRISWIALAVSIVAGIGVVVLVRARLLALAALGCAVLLDAGILWVAARAGKNIATDHVDNGLPGVQATVRAAIEVIYQSVMTSVTITAIVGAVIALACGGAYLYSSRDSS